MTSVDRDLQVVRLVAEFEAMTISQIGGVLFAANASRTPVKRVVARLVAQKYLAPYKWRLTTNRPGSAEKVYQLAVNGWRFIGYEGTYKRLEAFDRHKLAIADFYVALTSLERLGLIEVLEYVTEPNCWERIRWRRARETHLKPDLYALIRNKADGKVRKYWFEIDLGSEHEKQIRAKAGRYSIAWDDVDPDDPRWRTFPHVVFVAQTVEGFDADLKRKAQLTNWVGGSELFSVCTAAEVAALLVGA